MEKDKQEAKVQSKASESLVQHPEKTKKSPCLKLKPKQTIPKKKLSPKPTIKVVKVGKTGKILSDEDFDPELSIKNHNESPLMRDCHLS